MIRMNTAKSIFITLFFCLLTIAISKTTAAQVNYDTAWTFVYDGGNANISGKMYPINDKFFDVKVLPNGTSLCIGGTGDSLSVSGLTLLFILSPAGQVLKKMLYTTNNKIQNYYNSQTAHSLVIAKNGDFIVGGERFGAPWVFRSDSLGNLKWSTWYYDSIKDQSKLQKSASINCIRETNRGTIICVAGDDYPNNNGLTLNNYAALLEIDSAGQQFTRLNQWNNETGYNISGFYVDETIGRNYVSSGNQSVFYVDTLGNTTWKKNYTYSLAGVGSEVANVCRAKVLRDNSLMVAGQAYESDCWTKWQTFYYAAWWTPASYTNGTNTNWDTAGEPKGSDAIRDFTQLDNGNLVFVGTKATEPDSGSWVYVTDSTGKQLYWEKQFNLPGIDAGGNPLTNLLPLSICASRDSGFTIVGDNNTSGNNHNAFAMHFVPTPIVSVTKRISSKENSCNFHSKMVGSKVIFSFNNLLGTSAMLSIYFATGKRVAILTKSRAQAGSDFFAWDYSHLGKGVYLYQLLANGGLISGQIIVGR